jgi:hypothetical protein
MASAGNKKIIYAALSVFIMIVSCIAYIIIDSANDTNPHVLYGEKSRASVNNYLSAEIPASATALNYSMDGFMDFTCHIGMTIPSDEAWKLIEKSSGKINQP